MTEIFEHCRSILSGLLNAGHNWFVSYRTNHWTFHSPQSLFFSFLDKEKRKRKLVCQKNKKMHKKKYLIHYSSHREKFTDMQSEMNFSLWFEKGIKYFFLCIFLLLWHASFLFLFSLSSVVLVMSLTEVHLVRILEEPAGNVNWTLYLQVFKFLLSILAVKIDLLLPIFCAAG